MSFRWYVYYCALFGGCAAYVGWALGRVPAVQAAVWLAAVRGMFLGLTLAVGLTLVDVIWHPPGRGGAEVTLRVLVAGLIGGAGGFVGGMLGQLLYSGTRRELFLVFGWTVTGVLLGAAPGAYDLLARLARGEDSSGAVRKLANGVLGGLLGGAVGGLLFLAARGAWGLFFSEKADEFWSPSAMGFVALGLCIGLFIGLARVILKTAWVVVAAGFRQGREMLLEQAETVIGRAEGCDVPLYGDPGVEKRHARILLRGGRYLLEDLGTAGGTFLNGQRVGRPAPLRSGDLIELGRSSLRFGERGAACLIPGIGGVGMAKARERKPKRARSVRLVLDPAEGVGVVCVRAGKEATYYTVREIGGRGFAMHKLGMGPLYHVRVGEREDCSCECRGFLRHGSCKHLLGLLALVEARKV